MRPAQLAASAEDVQRADLEDTTLLKEVDARISPPDGWVRQPTQQKSMATHVQFRNPDESVRLGVVRLRLPLPLSADAIMWLARKGYNDKHGKPVVLSRWTDEAGRHWVIGQDDKWQAEAYIFVTGLRGWIVYRSWLREPMPSQHERDLAQRALRTAVPLVDK